MYLCGSKYWVEARKLARGPREGGKRGFNGGMGRYQNTYEKWIMGAKKEGVRRWGEMRECIGGATQTKEV